MPRAARNYPGYVATSEQSSGEPSRNDTKTSGEGGPPPEQTSTARRLRELASKPFRQKPGSPETQASRPAPGTKEIVNGLDHTELTLAICATVFEIGFTIIGYFLALRHSANLDVRRAAPSVLLAGMVGGAILALGTAFRRRALVGFACFIVGFEMISFSAEFGSFQLQGFVYIILGLWLIMRVMRKQKQDRQRPKLSKTVDARTVRRRSDGPPQPSKRYTPPRRARSVAAKKR
jgi:uncharacterized protein YneF (UPF0154 family)